MCNYILIFNKIFEFHVDNVVSKFCQLISVTIHDQLWLFPKFLISIVMSQYHDHHNVIIYLLINKEFLFRKVSDQLAPISFYLLNYYTYSFYFHRNLPNSHFLFQKFYPNFLLFQNNPWWCPSVVVALAMSGRNTLHFYPCGSPNTPLSFDSCMSQVCEHTWYTEGIIFHYIRLDSIIKVERSSKALKEVQRSAKFHLFIKVLLFHYKPLLTFSY